MALGDRKRRFTPHGEWSTTPTASTHPSAKDIAWAAGFLEGEGSFTHTGTAERVSASQVDTEPLHRLQRLFGGKLSGRTNQRGFGLFGNPAQYIHRWTVNSARARGVALTVYTFLSARRQEQVKAMLAKFKRQQHREPRARRVNPSR